MILNSRFRKLLIRVITGRWKYKKDFSCFSKWKKNKNLISFDKRLLEEFWGDFWMLYFWIVSGMKPNVSLCLVLLVSHLFLSIITKLHVHEKNLNCSEPLIIAHRSFFVVVFDLYFWRWNRVFWQDIFMKTSITLRRVEILIIFRCFTLN